MTDGLLELAAIVNVSLSLGAPEVMPFRGIVCAGAFCGRTRSGIALIVGGWLTCFTVTVKLRRVTLFAGCESFASTVMVATPEAYATGVISKVPLVAGDT